MMGLYILIGTLLASIGIYYWADKSTKKSSSNNNRRPSQQQNAQGNANAAQPVATAPNNAVAQANGTLLVLLTYIVLIIAGIVIWNLWPRDTSLAEQRTGMTDQECIDSKQFTFDSRSELRPAKIKHDPKKGKMPLKNYHFTVVGGELIGTDMYNNPIHLPEGEYDMWGDQYLMLYLKVAAGDKVTLYVCYYIKPF